MPQVVLAHGVRQVDLVTKHQKGDGGEAIVRQQARELALRLGEALAVGGVDQVDDGVDFGVVVLPDLR
jgi:hypothetical protein